MIEKTQQLKCVLLPSHSSTSGHCTIHTVSCCQLNMYSRVNNSLMDWWAVLVRTLLAFFNI